MSTLKPLVYNRFWGLSSLFSIDISLAILGHLLHQPRGVCVFARYFKIFIVIYVSSEAIACIWQLAQNKTVNINLDV